MSSTSELGKTRDEVAKACELLAAAPEATSAIRAELSWVERQFGNCASIGGIRTKAPDFLTFTVRDLRRTFRTPLNRAKFDERWIDRALAHAPRNRAAATCNAARCAAEPCIMKPAWVDMPAVREQGRSAEDAIAKAIRHAAEVMDLELADDL